MVMPPSCSKTDGLFVSRSSGRSIENDDLENFRDVLSVDRFETIDEEESFLLTCDVRLPIGTKQVSLAPGQPQQQQ